jgi:hypothetical protein
MKVIICAVLAVFVLVCIGSAIAELITVGFLHDRKR